MPIERSGDSAGGAKKEVCNPYLKTLYQKIALLEKRPREWESIRDMMRDVSLWRLGKHAGRNVSER